MVFYSGYHPDNVFIGSRVLRRSDVTLCWRPSALQTRLEARTTRRLAVHYLYVKLGGNQLKRCVLL